VKITAAVTESKGAPFRLQELELGELRADEVLVEIAAAGICHTDLICRDQWLPVPLPAVLGHEGAGVVLEVGSAVANVAPRDRVGITFNSCGRCPTCLRGRSTYCHDFFGRNFASTRPDGTNALSRGGQPVHGHFFGQSSFATHSVANARNVVKLPDEVGLELAAPFGCGIQTGAGAVLNVMRPPAVSSLAVFGTGAVGLSGILAARSRVARRSSASTSGRAGSSSPASSGPRTSSTRVRPTRARRSAGSPGAAPTSRWRRPVYRACSGPPSTRSLRPVSAQ
jgi:aryl-alcohol dehydrogenase